MSNRPVAFKNPFSRPWMSETGAAAAAGEKAKGLKGVVAGGITGGIEICITFPTEYVKTQLQLDEKGGSKKYTGIGDCIKKTVKSHGVFGLYRGLSVLIYGSIPKSAVRFGVFEQARLYMVMEDGTLSTTGKLACGLAAGVSEAIFAVTPMETVKVKFINDLRLEKPRFRGFFHGVRTIVREDGAASVFGNTPIDVVKTRMQGLEAAKYKNTWDCFIKTWKSEGPFAFYKGTVPRLSRVVFDVAITFTIYDSIMDLFNYVWK
ncbi:hypothetical protein HF086_013310 [Spodoptera exigua]|uniref:Citrate transport protein n=1 Tax=Spodoptera exigua TaxID=7107 RepID=A0A922SLA8_SPOEX|nr:hypothetical protein HF086_013310 [Spodoptera exigua]